MKEKPRRLKLVRYVPELRQDKLRAGTYEIMADRDDPSKFSVRPAAPEYVSSGLIFAAVED